MVCVAAGIIFWRSTSVEPPPPQAVIVLSAKEQTVLKALLKLHLNTFAAGNASLFTKLPEGSEYVVTSAQQLQRDYAKDQAAADKAYLGKQILLRGNVTAIDPAGKRKYRLTFDGGPNPVQPQAFIEDSHKEYLSELEGGQEVKLACVGKPIDKGAAVVADCLPVRHWVNSTVDKTATSILAAANAGTSLPKFVVGSAIAATMNLPKKSSCWVKSPKSSCTKEVSTALYQTLKGRPELQAEVAARVGSEAASFDSLFK